MSTKEKKRAYDSSKRQSKAKETKRRILDSAKKLFKAKAYDLVTIEQIAKEAEISVPSVYLLFQSKRGILREIMDEALPQEEFQALVELGMKEVRPDERMRITAKLTRKLYDAEQSEMELFGDVERLSPELKELEREREERRYLRQEETIKIMAANSWLAPHLTVEQARDIFWAFTGRDLYRLFTIHRGWTSEAYERYLGDLLIKALLN